MGRISFERVGRVGFERGGSGGKWLLARENSVGGEGGGVESLGRPQ